VNSYQEFIKAFKEKSGLDLKAYKQNQMERRIRTFLDTHKYDNFGAFLKALDSDKLLYDKFFKHLTINVSQFFRDPKQWEFIRENLIPNYLNTKKALKIWSAGCSGGQEPYSLAIMLLEHFPNIRFSILAVDIDDNVLQQAKLGFYRENDLISTPPEIIKKYFTKTDKGYQIKDVVKKQITFKKQNLLTDKFETGFDLIACRNVVIYFTEEIKTELYKKFYNSLLTGGILFTGSSEHLFGTNESGFKSVSSFFYQKY